MSPSWSRGACARRSWDGFARRRSATAQPGCARVRVPDGARSRIGSSCAPPQERSERGRARRPIRRAPIRWRWCRRGARQPWSLAAEVARLVRAVRTVLEGPTFDDVDLYEATERAVGAGTAIAVPVVVFAPSGFPTGATALRRARALDRRCRDRPRDQRLACDDPELLHPDGPPPPIGCRFSTVTRALDASGEATEAARVIRSRIAAGVAPEQLAVVYSRRTRTPSSPRARSTVPTCRGASVADHAARGRRSQIRACARRGEREGGRAERSGRLRVGCWGAAGATAGTLSARSTSDPPVGITSAPLSGWANRLVADFALDGDEPEVAGEAADQGRSQGDGGGTSRRPRRRSRSSASLRRWSTRLCGIELALGRRRGPWLARALPRCRGGAVRLVGSGWRGRATRAERGRGDRCARRRRAVLRHRHVRRRARTGFDRDGPQVGRLGVGVVVGSSNTRLRSSSTPSSSSGVPRATFRQSAAEPVAHRDRPRSRRPRRAHVDRVGQS